MRLALPTDPIGITSNMAPEAVLAPPAPAHAAARTGGARGAFAREARCQPAASSDDLTGHADAAGRAGRADSTGPIRAAQKNAIARAAPPLLRPGCGETHRALTMRATLAALSGSGDAEFGCDVTLWDEIAPPAPRPVPADPARPAQNIGAPGQPR